MYSKYNRKFDIYKFEEIVDFSKSTNTIFNQLVEIYEKVDMMEFCDILKISPFVSDLNSAGKNTNRKKKVFKKLSEFIEKDASLEEKNYWKNYKQKVLYLNEILEKFLLFRDSYFSSNKTNQELNGSLLVVAAEKTMYELANIFNPNVKIIDGVDNVENRANTYDAYIGFISNVIKFFLFRKIPFNISSKIYSENDIEIASKHFGLNAHWDELTDVVEYFRFSDINIEKNDEQYTVDIIDQKFDKSVLISNFREKNYMASLNDTLISDLERKNVNISSLGAVSEYLSSQHCKRIFGVDNLDKEVGGIPISKWISSYFFIRNQAVKKLKNRKKIDKLSELCIVRPANWWKKQLVKHDTKITLDEANQIIKMFVFDKNSKDLIDNPLICFEDQLVLIPSITFDLSAEIALVSLVSHKNLQINFKGTEFEKRLQRKLELHGINAVNIAAHIDENKAKLNYETDLVFILNRVMFILECKSIIPPYTVKDHAKTNAKIISELEKFKKNASFFEKEQRYVKQKLNVSKNIEIKEIVKVFVTSSTLGAAGYFEGIYVIDEAALNAFLLRNSPLVRDSNMNVYAKQNRWDFEGEITAAKIKAFLIDPPSLKVMERHLKREEKEVDNMKITRYHKETPNQFLDLNDVIVDYNGFKDFISEY